jgi:protein TonB
MAQWSLANLAAWAVQVTVLVAAGVWLPGRLRLGSPRTRVLLFRTLLAACLALPLAQPWQPAPAVSVPVVLSDVPLPDPAAAGAPGNEAFAARPVAQPAGQPVLARARDWVASVPWSRVALFALAGGAALRLVWLGLGLVSLARLRRRSVPIDPDLRSIREAERTVGVGAAFRQAPRVARPVTFGLHRPVVLVPPGFADLDPGYQLAVACHELLHVRRQDWLRVLGDEIVRALLWFHPAIWWLVEQIHLSTEQMIDARAVEMVGDRRSYLRALLALAGADTRPLFQPAACFLDHGHLRQRVAMLMEEASMSRVRLVASVVVVAAVVAAGGWWSVSAFPLRDTVALPELPRMVAFAAAPAPVYSSLPPAAPGRVVGQDAGAPPQQQAPLAQATRPGMSTAPLDVPMDEASLKKMIQDKPNYLPAYYVLAQIYEKAGDIDRAVATLEAAANAAPQNRSVYLQLVGFYNRQGNFDKIAEWFDKWATMEPQSPEPHYTASAYYWEKVYRDTALTEAQKRAYLDHGLQEVDTALAMNGEYVEALTYKNLLLRAQAQIERDPAAQKALLAEADTLRARAIEIRTARQAAGLPLETYPAPKGPVGPYIAYAAAPPPPPPPPPPPAGARGGVAGGVSGGVSGGVTGGVGGVVPGGILGGLPEVPPPPRPVVGPDGKIAPVRVGGNIKPPVKIRDVKPVYPEEALQARVQGVVIIEALIDETGKVSDAKILRSIPLFDQAALEAVRQWEFTPTVLNGVPVPVIMTTTVTFTLDK